MVTPPSKHVSPVLLQLLLLQLLLLLLMWLPLSTTGAAAGPSLSAAAGASAVLRFQSLPNGPAPPPDTPTAAAPPIQQARTLNAPDYGRIFENTRSSATLN